MRCAARDLAGRAQFKPVEKGRGFDSQQFDEVSLNPEVHHINLERKSASGCLGLGLMLRCIGALLIGPSKSCLAAPARLWASQPRALFELEPIMSGACRHQQKVPRSLWPMGDACLKLIPDSTLSYMLQPGTSSPGPWARLLFGTNPDTGAKDEVLKS